MEKTSYKAAEAYLKANAGVLHIAQLLDRTSLTPLYGDPFHNSRVPDFIAVTDHGVICTGGTSLRNMAGFPMTTATWHCCCRRPTSSRKSWKR